MHFTDIETTQIKSGGDQGDHVFIFSSNLLLPFISLPITSSVSSNDNVKNLLSVF
jgi:hypothetical protein